MVSGRVTLGTRRNLCPPNFYTSLNGFRLVSLGVDTLTFRVQKKGVETGTVVCGTYDVDDVSVE